MLTHRFNAVVVVLVAGFLIAGCGQDEAETPEGCFATPASFASSLRQAPGEVLLGGETAISDCLIRNQPEGDLVNFGEVAIEVATRTGAAVSEPGPDGIKAAIDAGFLVGAMEKGAEESGGIHNTLVERVRSAASNGLSRAGKQKQAHYEAGREAGRDVG